MEVYQYSQPTALNLTSELTIHIWLKLTSTQKNELSIPHQIRKAGLHLQLILPRHHTPEKIVTLHLATIASATDLIHYYHCGSATSFHTDIVITLLNETKAMQLVKLEFTILFFDIKGGFNYVIKQRLAPNLVNKAVPHYIVN